MFDAEYFRNVLRQHVAQIGGAAVVRIGLYGGGEYYVRDVVNTEEGYVVVNVWHDQNGRPIVSPSSDAFPLEVPEGFHPVSVPFESISIVDVSPIPPDHVRRIGFRR